MEPGAVICDDFRDAANQNRQCIPRRLRLLQWNIERGYELSKVIAELVSCEADVIALQEVDVGCDRSCGRDTGRDIARALKMNYAFVCEFEELRSPLRTSQTQGGGFHGNAILSKFDFISTRAMEHRCNLLHRLMSYKSQFQQEIKTTQNPSICMYQKKSRCTVAPTPQDKNPKGRGGLAVYNFQS